MKRFLIFLGKLIVRFMKIFGKNAGNLPGCVLWTLTHHRCVSLFTVNCPVIAVTGTNGKTSVANYIAHLLEMSGAKVICNHSGNNLDTGICSLFLQLCDNKGNIKSDYIVLETDESYVPVIYAQIPLDTLVVLNFFRDQLDRNGEVETLIRKVENFCKTFSGTLILNADDPNTSRLSAVHAGSADIRYFHVEKYNFATDKLFEVGEGKFCPFCGTELQYDYYQYSHIGKFRCPKCGYGDVKPNITASHIDLNKSPAHFRIETKSGVTDYETPFNSIYHIYNMTAVAATAERYAIRKELLSRLFAEYAIDNGRMEHFLMGSNYVTLNLAKNPVGASLTIRMMNESENEKELLFVLNDNPADGLDVSWIWDISFSSLHKIKRIVTSGTRAYDIAVRIKCTGYDPDLIVIRPNLDDAVKELNSTSSEKFIIANYTAVQPIRASLKRWIEWNEGERHETG